MCWNTKNGVVPIGYTGMNYVSFGSGNKALIILPGLSDGLTTVKGKALLLALPYKLFFKDYTVYMFSRKNELPNNYSISEMADDQAEAMRRLGIEKAAVLGVSEGGMIAQSLAINHPAMVERLVIAVSAPYANDIVKSVVSSYPVVGWIGKPKNYHRFIVNANAILNFDCFDDLQKIHCPTLIIGGRTDQIVGCDASYKMYEQIYGSEIYIYEKFGHAAYEEANDFNKRVFDYLVR